MLESGRLGRRHRCWRRANTSRRRRPWRRALGLKTHVEVTWQGARRQLLWRRAPCHVTYRAQELGARDADAETC